MRKLRLTGLAFGVLGLMAVAISCTKQSASSSNNNAASAAVFQSPTVGCAINNGSSTNGSSTIINLSNLDSASNFATPPTAPAAISIDCSQTSSHANAPVTLTYSVNGGPATAFSSGLKDVNDPALNFSTHGINTITITASDGITTPTSVTFSLPVSCDPNSYPAVSGPTGLTVSAGADGAGYANIAFSGAASGGGGGPYTYAIDINGDGRFDDYSPVANSDTPTPILRNSTPVWNDVYNFYSGTRPISVQVYDTACQFMKTFNYSYNWSTGVLSGAQTGPATTIPPTESYFYMQANVSSLSSSNDPAEAVTPFDARESGIDPNSKHVICNWSESQNSSGNPQGQFTITASNTYNDGVANDASQLNESMSLSFNIPDTGATLGPETLNLSSMTYQTSASPGGYLQYSYSMNTGCTAYVQVTRLQAVGTCTTSPNSGYEWPQATIQGTFSCPNLASQANGSSTKRNLSLQNGYFYCQTSVGSNCVGGGQEGGSPPTGF